MANLFVSYARADQPIVQSLIGELRELGHEPFFDQNLTGGQRWWDVLLDRIQASDGFLPVLSEEYRKSEACHLEADWANSLNVALLPIDLGQIGPELCSSNIAEANWVRYSLDDRASVARLARAIGAMPRANLPSPLPERPGIPISYLAATEREIRISPALSIERQLVILAALRAKLDTNEDSSARVLLRELRDRQDITYTNALDIDRLLDTPARRADTSKPAAPPPATTAPAMGAAAPPMATPPSRPQTPPNSAPAYRPGSPAMTPPPTGYRPDPARPAPQQPMPQQAQQPVQQPVQQPSPPHRMPPPGHPSPAYAPPTPRNRAVQPLGWVALGLGLILMLLSLLGPNWLAASGTGGKSISYDYSKVSSVIGTGPGDPGVSIVFFSWLGYVLFIALVVLAILITVLPRRIAKLAYVVAGVGAVTLLLTIISTALLVNRIDDQFGNQGVSASYPLGFWLGVLGIVALSATAFIPRRRPAR